ncbi:hypothetical protein [Magnetospirillum sp. ME-1]|uniref:hypothetical protein n=1 Tax=Magnetospirillum sp. ME-1 TaxID=1639348 RepID=UPI0011AE6889|nr:hypothetical protein [Magnetospirillum sp. ME-1]
MAIQIFAMLALPAAAQAATICEAAPNIVSCFHPTAKYLECSMSGRDTAVIRFKGGITGRPYAMQVRSERKDNFSRLILLDDNAAVPPSQKCGYLQWQPLSSAEKSDSVQNALSELTGGSNPKQ